MKLSLSPRAIACAFAAITTSACTATPEALPPVTEVAQVSVQPGATTTSAPGSGVGLFVQYDPGGHWRVWTTCDASITHASCAFDVTVSTSSGAKIANVQGVDLQPADTFVQDGDGSITLLTETTLGSDGISFDADPGATIQVGMLLDGISEPRDMFVVSQGGVLQGVPTNPVDLRPEAP
jgi:hypothetical protein